MPAGNSATPASARAETTEDDYYVRRYEDLVNSQLSLLNHQDYSDVTIYCHDRVWHCHRAILLSRCPLFKDFICDDNGKSKITLHNDSVANVEQLLIYLYTLKPPSFLPDPENEDYEMERDKIWSQASEAYMNGAKYELNPPKDAALEAILLHALRLCKRWDRFDQRRRSVRIEMISEVWTHWGGDSIVNAVKAAIVRGMVRVADKICECQLMHGLLRRNHELMFDYVRALSYEVGKKQAKTETPIPGNPNAPIEIS